MARPNYGPQAKKQARQLLEALLTYANDELEDCDYLKLECYWRSETQLIVKTKVRQLEALSVRVCQDGKLTSGQIKEALKRYQDFLEILEDHRTKTQGADDWHFTLKLWFGRYERAANLRRLDAEWERHHLEKSKQVTAATAALQQGVEPSDEASALDDLVQSSRQKVSASIQARCGTMRVLDMSRPIELDAIYTTVNIYESISGRQRQGLADLLQQLSLEAFTHWQSQKTRLSGLTAVEQYSKLLVFGKPGAGKTAFLKWLAIQCNSGHRWATLIPVFVTVKAFAEAKGQPELLSYIQKQWVDCGVLQTQAETLVQQGRALILLDGLDEVRESDHNRVLQELREFSTRFHTCLFVMSCRVAAQEYTFEQFTEVELADFDDQQITDFVTKWFAAKCDPTKTAQFLKQLHDQRQIRDLATSPLLLTLLCLVFQEADDFPTNRAELYREALEVLLRTWDARRNIERDRLHQRGDLYQKLSLQCKEALLGQIAFTTFERGDYFFKQQAVEQYITEFLRALATTTIHGESAPWEIDSLTVLKSIEAQHGLLVERARGIYSFSHLTFHEYFTAKNISDKPADHSKAVLQALASHVTEQAWQEVFFLTASMLPSADALLMTMKAQIDRLLSSDATLQSFLSWLNEKAIAAINNPTQVGLYYKPAIVRAYHSFLILDSVSIKASAIAIGSVINRTSVVDNMVIGTSSTSDNEEAIARVISSATDNERAIAIAIILSSSTNRSLEIMVDRNMYVSSAMNKAIEFTSDLALKQSLQDLRTQLPEPKGDQTAVKQWWKDHGHIWTTQLKEAQIHYRDLAYDWQFSESQMALLDQYYRANLLLVNCLNSDCYVSQAVRDEVEATLLLSAKDIEQYQKISTRSLSNIALH